MLRFRGSTGSIEALPEQEARVRSLTDAALRQELEREPQPDPFALAEAIDRQLLAWAPRVGWHLASAPRRH